MLPQFDVDIKLLNDLTMQYWTWNLFKEKEFNLFYKYGPDKIRICFEDNKYYMKLSESIYFKICEKINVLNKSAQDIFRSTIGVNFIIKQLEKV